MSVTSFKHAGAIGDCIYSLPTVLDICNRCGTKAHYKLALNVPMQFAQQHPLGNVGLNDDFAGKLLPLLASQPYIAQASIHDGGPVDYDLDMFRQIGFDFQKGHITRWLAYAFTCNPQPHLQWLHVTPTLHNRIVINRSGRHRNSAINYDFLKPLADKITFVGLDEEYATIGFGEHKKFDNYLQLAQFIAGCRFFIGNQSFCYSLAEGMKVNRMLEVYPPAPNCTPSGPRGWDAISQIGFEKAVDHLLKTSVTRPHAMSDSH